MAIEDMIPQFLAGSAIGAILAASIVFILIIGLAFYIYFSLVWMVIAKKLGHKYPWLAWIPVARTAMILQLGNFGWGWVFLILLPIIGWIALVVLVIIAKWRIFEKRKYPGWLALVPLAAVIPHISPLAGIANIIIMAFVAWKDQK
ncbi:hypothetical protein KY345_06725 [Candidatus Woesearchaeota archaeon]|nr:hypothetical protein [Candidatus Woesearchaeota archaeon]